METAVAAGGVGDIPEGVGSGGILQRATAQGIGVAVGVFGAVAALGCIGILSHPFPVGKDVGVESVLQEPVFLLLGVFGFEILIGDGIQQSCAVNADGRFQAYFVGAYVIAFVGYINGAAGNLYLRIAQLVGLPIGEAVAPFIGIFVPSQLNLCLVQGFLERSDGMGLRHAGQPGDVSVGFRVVDNQQVTVADAVGAERPCGLALSMAVARMAVLAGGADVDRTQSVAHAVEIGGVRFLEKLFAPVESSGHHGVSIHHRCGVLEGRRRGVGGGAKFATCVIPVRQLGRFGSRIWIVRARFIIAAGHQAGYQRRD